MSEACPLCGSAQMLAGLTRRSPDGDVELARCGRCGLVMQRARLSSYDAELYAYYANLQSAEVDAVYPALNDQRQQEVLESLSGAGGRRLLDVGCGIGQFVRTAARSGWTARGIDLAHEAIAVARKHEVPCEVLDFFSPSLDAARFEVITMFEFIEHVADPMPFFRRAAELLVPGGLLYLTTPNFESIDRMALGADWRVIHPEHLLYFSPRTLRRAVDQVQGFKVERVWAHNISADVLAKVRSLAQRRRASGTEASGADEQALRQAVEGRLVARVAKAGLNRVLSALGVGSTVKLLATRR